MNSTIRFLSLLIMSVLISGCLDDSPSVEGNWISTDNNCKSFCSFKIKNNTNVYSDLFVVFDDESMPQISSGFLVRTSDESFLIQSPGGDMLVRFNDGKFYFTDGVVYEKNEDRYLAYQKILAKNRKQKMNEQKKIAEKKDWESAEVNRINNPASSGRDIIPTPEERWNYIKELESRQAGQRNAVSGSGQSSLTDEQKQLLNQMQSDMK